MAEAAARDSKYILGVNIANVFIWWPAHGKEYIGGLWCRLVDATYLWDLNIYNNIDNSKCKIQVQYEDKNL